MISHTGSGKRQGISLMQLADMFPNEEAARKWFEEQRWPDGAHCPHCGSVNVAAVGSLKPMPYRCRDCRKHFSVRTKTAMAESKIPLRKWAFGIYLYATSLKSVSSMKLHRDLNITQKSAWFMAHRIREAFEVEGGLFAGPVEINETYIGGKRKNMSKAKRKTGRGATLQGVIRANAEAGATIYTDDAAACMAGFEHEAVQHSVGKYVQGMAPRAWRTPTAWSRSGPCSSAGITGRSITSAPSTCNATSMSSRRGKGFASVTPLPSWVRSWPAGAG